jgi:hypothetical protein
MWQIYPLPRLYQYYDPSLIFIDLVVENIIVLAAATTTTIFYCNLHGKIKMQMCYCFILF